MRGGRWRVLGGEVTWCDLHFPASGWWEGRETGRRPVRRPLQGPSLDWDGNSGSRSGPILAVC